MRSVIGQPGGLLPSGEIRFFEACIPPLQAGAYLLVADQQVSSLDPPAQLDSYELPTPQPFTVYGPRFRLQPTDIQMVYPPASQQGTFAESLPHAVLSGRDLPWSRGIDPVSPGTPPANTPWLALLTVYGTGEMSAPSPLVTTPVQMTVADLVSPPAGVVGPQLGTLTAGELAQSTLAFDVDPGLFTAIAPAQGEVAFLAHARQVDTAAKKTGGGVQEGFFSVVIGNRLPDSSVTESRESFAFLVSLEGHWDHLPGGAGPGGDKVRLVVLASWNFTASQNDGDFVDILHNLPEQGGVDLLTMPFTPDPTSTPEADYAQEALALGYLARHDSMRAGETTTSWFRGPLTPYPTAVDPYGPYATSDAAIRYDPQRGLLDRSYAAAWQIGRLLALADGGFTQAVLAWQRAMALWKQTLKTDGRLLERLGEGPLGAAAAAPGRTRRHQLVLGALLGLLGREAKGATPIPTFTPRSRRLDREACPGVLSVADFEEARRRGDDPLLAVVGDLLTKPEWRFGTGDLPLGSATSPEEVS